MKKKVSRNMVLGVFLFSGLILSGETVFAEENAAKADLYGCIHFPTEFTGADRPDEYFKKQPDGKRKFTVTFVSSNYRCMRHAEGTQTLTFTTSDDPPQIKPGVYCGSHQPGWEYGGDLPIHTEARPSGCKHKRLNFSFKDSLNNHGGTTQLSYKRGDNVHKVKSIDQKARVCKESNTACKTYRQSYPKHPKGGKRPIYIIFDWDAVGLYEQTEEQ